MKQPIENSVLPFPQSESPDNQTLIEFQRQLHVAMRAEEKPITQIMTWLLDRRNLQSAWDRVKRGEGANTPGLDGVTCQDISSQLGGWLAKLSDEIYNGKYAPQPPRWIEVPKNNDPNSFRKLGILTIKDRVIGSALKQVLEPVVDHVFLPSSFGFRPGRSVAGALQQAVDLLQSEDNETRRFTHGIQLDVADCFPTIDHEMLRIELGRFIADPDFMKLTDRVLLAGGETVGKLWWQRKRGLVQGSALSPLLCNLYLHPLDLALNDLGQATNNGVKMLRYADDMLLLGKDARTVERAISLIRQILRRYQQKLKDTGATVVPVEAGLEWLGVRIQPRSHRWKKELSFGYVIPDAKVQKMLQRIDEMTNPPSNKIDSSAFNPARWIVSINQQLRDWRQAYLFADNAPDVFRVLDDHCREKVAHLLQAIYGCKLHQVYRQYRVNLPRGFWSWEVPGARLAVLSSLAPHAPAQLTRKPNWMRKIPAFAKRKAKPKSIALPAALPVAMPVEARPAVAAEKAVVS